MCSGSQRHQRKSLHKPTLLIAWMLKLQEKYQLLKVTIITYSLL